MAKRLGIKSKLDAFCSITLGSVAVNNLEMTNAYSTLAAHGMLHRATPVLEVTRQNGGRSQKHFSFRRASRCSTPNIADEVTYALEGVVTGGTGYAARPRYPWLLRLRQDRHRAGQRRRLVLRIHPGSSPPACGSATRRSRRRCSTSRACRRSTAARSPRRSGTTTCWRRWRSTRRRQATYDQPEFTGTIGPVGAGLEPDPPAEPDRDALTFDRADAHAIDPSPTRRPLADGDAESHGGAEGVPAGDHRSAGERSTHAGPASTADRPAHAEALGRFVQHGLALGRRVVHRQRRHDGGAASG